MDNLGSTGPEVDCDDGKLAEELFHEAKKNIYDPDEVMVAGGVVSDSKQTFSRCLDNEEEDDDDCVILDGDPDKPVEIKNVGDDSDDLCLISEKGQVACRDYPHPRHLCVKFPFSSTPHERHCDKCHCYVCETVAPCIHWGNGVSSVDHCHATEKNAFWDDQRRHAKTSCKATAFVSQAGPTPVNQVLSLSTNNLSMHNEEPSASQLCSVTSTGTPCSAQESSCHPNYKFRSDLVRYHLQRQSVGHTSTQFVSEVGLNPLNQVLSLPFNNSLMHNEGPPADQLADWSTTGTGTPYGAAESECYLSNKFQPHLVQNHLQIGPESTQFVSEGGLTPTNQFLSLPSNNPVMHNEEPPASQLYPITSPGIPYGAQESGCHPSDRFQPHLVHYHMQGQHVGHAGIQFDSEVGLTPVNRVLSFRSRKPLMHNEEPPTYQLYPITSAGIPYSAQESGCHPNNRFRPHSVHYHLQGQHGHAGTQFVSQVGLTPVNQVLSLPGNDTLMNNEEPPGIQLFPITGPGIQYGVQESACHSSSRFQPHLVHYHMQGQPVGHAGIQFVSEVGLTPVNQVLSLSNKPLMHNEEPPTSRASVGTPHGAQEFGCHSSNKFQPHLVRFHLQRQDVGHVGTQLTPQRVPFKRTSTFRGTLTTAGYFNNYCRNNYGSQSSENESLGSRCKDPRERENPILSTYEHVETDSGVAAANSLPNSSTWSSVGIELENYAPSQPQVYPHVRSSSTYATSAAPRLQLPSQTSTEINLDNLMPAAPRLATEQRWGSHLANTRSLQPEAASQPNAHENVLPTQPLVTSNGNSESPVTYMGKIL